MISPAVDALFDDFTALLGFLDQNGQISLRSISEDAFRKALLLAAASHFETLVTATIQEFVREASADSDLVASFVDRKALKRNYHTLFDWEKKNANGFFALFGDAFSQRAKARVKADTSYAESVTSFLSIGSDRNRLVHQNYATFSLEKTAEEIYELYKSGLGFVVVTKTMLWDEVAHQSHSRTLARVAEAQARALGGGRPR